MTLWKNRIWEPVVQKKKHQKIKQSKKITEHFRNTEVYNIF